MGVMSRHHQSEVYLTVVLYKATIIDVCWLNLLRDPGGSVYVVQQRPSCFHVLDLFYS